MLTRELKILQRITGAASLAPDVGAVAGQILDVLLTECGAQQGAIMRPEGHSLTCLARRGDLLDLIDLSAEGPSGVKTLSAGQTLVWRALGCCEAGCVLLLVYPGRFDEADLLDAILPSLSLVLSNALMSHVQSELDAVLRDTLPADAGRNIIKIFNQVSLAILTIELDGTVSTINRPGLELLGLQPGDSIEALVGGSLLSHLKVDMDDLTLDVRHGDKLLALDFVYLALNRRILVSVKDVTAQRFHESQLLTVKAQYYDMLEHSADAMYIVQDSRFVLANRKLQDLLGYGDDELIGQHYRHVIHRDSLRTLAEAFDECGQKLFIPNLEIQALRRDGSSLWLEISIGRLRGDERVGFAGVVRDINSRKEMLEMKNRFLNIASHEIRVPLTVIRGYARMLKKNRDQNLTAEQQECVAEICGQCERLLNFSNSLLELSKASDGCLSLDLSELDLAEVVDGVVRSMNVRARESEVCVAARLDSGLPKLLADRVKLEQAVINLVDNAIKHSPAGAVVRVDVTSESGASETLDKLLHRDRIVIAVKDSGSGIRPAEADKLFDEFFVGSSGARKKGIGLGLAITREIVHAHGGHVRAIPSQNGGHFEIIIPLNSQGD